MLLAAYCEQVSQWEHWQGKFRETEDVKTQLKISIKIKDTCNQMQSLAAQFGLSPKSRRMMKEADKNDDTDELRGFINAGHS